MGKAIAALVVTVVCVVLVVNFRTHGTVQGVARLTKPAAKTAAGPSSPSTGSTPSNPPTSTTPSTLRAPSRAAAPTAKTVDGADVSTQYGDVQVQVTVRSGRITDVKALLLPNDRPRSVEISQQAEPILRTEALQAQSAQIDILSGASFTSEGYAQSLQSALDKARGA
jgi:uncharacterized protein with FMN-binding domain